MCLSFKEGGKGDRNRGPEEGTGRGDRKGGPEGGEE